MAKENTPNSDQLYSAYEAAEFLKVKEGTIKGYCRKKEITGTQVGPRKAWHVSGAEIIRKAKEWNLPPFR